METRGQSRANSNPTAAKLNGKSPFHQHRCFAKRTQLTNDADSNKTVAEFEYDGLNRRIIKKVYDSSGSLDETRHFYYSNQWQVLQEDALPDGGSLAVDRQLIWGLRYIDDLVLRDRSDTGTLDERLYALQDANWNVVAVTDTTGAVKQRYEYTVFTMPKKRLTIGERITILSDHTAR